MHEVCTSNMWECIDRDKDSCGTPCYIKVTAEQFWGKYRFIVNSHNAQVAGIRAV